MKITDTIINRVAENFEREYKGVNNFPRKEIAEEVASEYKAKEQLDYLKHYAGNMEGKKILEVGSSYGNLIVFARQQGYDWQGMEPDEEAFAVSKELLKLNNISEEYVTHGFGEKLPYKDESFDIVFSQQVLEHVNDPEAVIKEAFRVLKPGGHFHFCFPNFRTFFEMHYGLFWFPYFPKWAAKIWVRLWGRDPSYVDTLQFLTPTKVKRYLKSIDNYELMSMGEDIFSKRIRTLEFTEYGGTSKVKIVLKLFKKLKLNIVLEKLSFLFGWYTPIFLNLKKQR